MKGASFSFLIRGPALVRKKDTRRPPNNPREPRGVNPPRLSMIKIERLTLIGKKDMRRPPNDPFYYPQVCRGKSSF